MRYCCFAGADKHSERPTEVWQFRRILPCLCKNLFGVPPGDLSFAVRMAKKGLQRFSRPRLCSTKSLHVFEVEAKQLCSGGSASPRVASRESSTFFITDRESLSAADDAAVGRCDQVSDARRAYHRSGRRKNYQPAAPPADSKD